MTAAAACLGLHSPPLMPGLVTENSCLKYSWKPGGLLTGNQTCRQRSWNTPLAIHTSINIGDSLWRGRRMRHFLRREYLNEIGSQSHSAKRTCPHVCSVLTGGNPRPQTWKRYQVGGTEQFLLGPRQIRFLNACPGLSTALCLPVLHEVLVIFGAHVVYAFVAPYRSCGALQLHTARHVTLSPRPVVVAPCWNTRSRTERVLGPVAKDRVPLLGSRT